MFTHKQLQLPRQLATGLADPLHVQTAGSALAAEELLLPPITAVMGPYQVRLANNPEERQAACRLRFKVFNIELGEGLEASY